MLPAHTLVNRTFASELFWTAEPEPGGG